jgi:hypothetical protein
MGYSVHNSSSSFFITKDSLPHVLEALRVLPSWEEADVQALSHIFQHFGLDISEDADGNITDLFLATEHLGDAQAAVFHAIAPFVTDKSYVMFVGEDNAQWAWVFRKNAETGTVEAYEEDVIPVLASEYRRLTEMEVSS